MIDELGRNLELRDYLLGNILESDITRIEEKLMIVDEYFQQLLIEEEELIQDYVDGDLNFSETKKFEERFLNSEERISKVQFARGLRKVLSEPPPQNKPIVSIKENGSFWNKIKKLFRQPIPVFSAILVILIFSIFLIWKFNNSANNSEFIASLNKTYSNERPLESRISDLNYAPTAPKTRGIEDEKVNKNELKRAELIALNAISQNPSAENYHNLGRYYLSVKNFDEAIKQFESAEKISTDNAKIQNDLGVAWMEKGNLDLAKENSKSLEFRVKANEKFEIAINNDKNLAEAYFNKALVLQEMNSFELAKQAWKDYLKLDSNSKWAEEAQKNLQKLEDKKSISKNKEQILQDFLIAYHQSDHEKSWEILSNNREMITVRANTIIEQFQTR